MKPAAVSLASVSICLGLTGNVFADMVADWNVHGVATTQTARQSPSMAARNLAIVHLAVFEALNSVEPRYAPYLAQLPADPASSAEAAAAAAAHQVLVRLIPEQTQVLDAALRDSLAGIAEGPAKDKGMQLGRQAAEAILGVRSNDGSAAPNTYRPYTVAGRYVPTGLPQGYTWGSVRPFVLERGDQFRPPAPYPLTSAQWAKDFNEIKRMGVKVGSGRTPEQSDIARFWALTGPATYNPVARQVSQAKQLDLLDNARLFALFSMATADAAIAIFDAKYAYNLWRPITAIRNADIDENDATQLDAAWEPFIDTPMHPEYPCAHCTFQGAAAGALEAMFGDAIPPFSLTSTAAPGVTRRFERLSDYVAEVIDARVFDGVHYRTSGEAGAALGRRVGEYVVQNALKPRY